MRLHVNDEAKEIVLTVVKERGMTASRANAWIVEQWYLNTHNKEKLNAEKKSF